MRCEKSRRNLTFCECFPASSQYFDDVKMQTEAKKWADEFNKKKVPKKVDFIAAYIVELTDR